MSVHNLIHSIFRFISPIVKQNVITFCLCLSLVFSSMAGFSLFLSPPLPVSASPVEIYVSKLQTLRDRFDKLGTYVQDSNWGTIKTYIHGPLGEIRTDISFVTRRLSAENKTAAKAITKNLFSNLVKLDVAASDRNPLTVNTSYLQARKDFDQLLDLLK
jgi:photosystem II protein PsbQ